jgi:transcriptional regulator with XRE-family HTH domain
LTQRGLAETIGCTIYAICNYEQGQRHPADPFDMRIKKLMRKSGMKVVDEEDEE